MPQNAGGVENQAELKPEGQQIQEEKIEAELAEPGAEELPQNPGDVPNLFPVNAVEEKNLTNQQEVVAPQNNTIKVVDYPKNFEEQEAQRMKLQEKFQNIFGDGALGDLGESLEMPEALPPDAQKLYDEGWTENEFNQLASDLISVKRKLPDMRVPFCLDSVKHFEKVLQPTSVIIVFCNEAWSTLLRSVHSILDRSPDRLIEEIILVDDFSDEGLRT